jgi:capsid protein
LNIVQMENGHALRSGIEFDQQGRRVAYRFYRDHPGESMYYPDAYVYVRIPADEIRHVYKFIRARNSSVSRLCRSLRRPGHR